MPPSFILAIIAFVLFLILLLGWIATRRSRPRESRIVRNISLVLLLASVAFTANASFNTVPTKTVGVEVSFSRPVGTMSNGPYWILPWNKIAELDAAKQTDVHNGEKDCFKVRITGQATACIDVSISWRILTDAADTLYQDHRELDDIRRNLVTRQLGAALTATFDDYDPLGVDEEGNPTAPSLAVLSENTTKEVGTKIGDQIEAIDVLVTLVDLDPNTDERVNALQSQIAQTRIAQQAELTATAQAAANAALAASVSNDPNVLVSQCMDILDKMVNKNLAPPAGFTCWPGSQSALVLPSTGTNTPR